ncbi:UNC-like C-terminal-domain-containing protein [Xylariaceae sp. FL0016]|nr:UNC-like C-terminal-domain-containing protein [Xylariaceae sp. FL0016]
MEIPKRVLALASLVLLLAAPATRAQDDATANTAHDARTCESRTVNYITHTLPQQCLTSSPSASTSATATAPESATTTTTTTATNASSHSVESTAQPALDPSIAAQDDRELDADGNDLSTGAFMSFEEWKAMMLAKSGPDALEPKPRRPKDGRADAYPGEGFDSLGDEGEISFDFDAYSDKISEIASPVKSEVKEKDDTKQTEEVATYDEGLTHYRSKDAGKTCKERFSYSSFDAGATVLKASPGTKNTNSILVENKDSYMLLECGMANKFFIVELSDVILIDTVVLANFEFFSSMVRHFRVSISDRYPVKLEKWKVLGTFEARNSRSIQPFLVGNPQDWARYIRVEILSHYGNEYYCPVSLLRVHGLRMLDSWKAMDPGDLDNDDDSSKVTAEATVETIETVVQEVEPTEVVEPSQTDNYTMVIEQSAWTPYWDVSYFQHSFGSARVCAFSDMPDPTSHIPVDARRNAAPAKPQPVDTAEQTSSAANFNTSVETTATQPAGSSAVSASTGSPAAPPSNTTIRTVPGSTFPSSKSVDPPSMASDASASQGTTESPAIQGPSRTKTTASTSMKPPPARSPVKTSSGSWSSSRNKTSATSSSMAASPTVQDSFFKALTKRLQTLESNTTLSLQYIESQSKFLQEALARLEKRQVVKVDHFLDTLNKTVLGELHEVRTQYDQIWQSTVIALETQREQSEREIVALSSRLGVLADEVVFQKRMAIVQSILLLGCLVLVIFSRGIAGTSMESYYPSQFLGSSSRLTSPIFPSTPRAHIRSTHHSVANHIAEGSNSASSTPLKVGNVRNYQPDMRMDRANHSPSQTPETLKTNSHSDRSESGGCRPSPSRVMTDPSGVEFYQPPTPSSMDLAYDSEPAMTPGGDYFSAATSVNGDNTDYSGSDPSYPDVMASQAERQLTPTSEIDITEYMQRSGRPTLMHVGSARKPLPALPEDEDPD